MKTFRVGQSLHTGKFLADSPGFGVLGVDIPIEGYIHQYLDMPSDNDKEMRGEILSWPSAGELVVYNDTTWEFTGPNGSYEFTFQGYRDNVPFGPVRTVSFTVGETNTYEYTGSGGVLVGGSAVITWDPEGPRVYDYAGTGGVVVGGSAIASKGNIGGVGVGGGRGGGVAETIVERLLRENTQKHKPTRVITIRTYPGSGGVRVGGAAKTQFIGKPQTHAAESMGGALVGGAAVVQFKPRVDPAVRRARRNAVLIMAASARHR
jgi:hypothetical protein